MRRLVDLAWAGGALPVVVVSPDPQGAVAVALAGAPVVLAAPAAADAGPAGQMARAIELACSEVDATDAALLWPAGMGWLDAETVTSLIEAHGADRDALLRPAFRATPGWPILLPVGRLPALRALSADLATGGRSPRRSPPCSRPAASSWATRASCWAWTRRGTACLASRGRRSRRRARRHEWGALVAAGPDEAPEPPATRD